MNFKRCTFVGALMILFLCCYHIMNQHYDELSRYQYANEENRELILEYLSTEDINVLIDRQYKPEDFLRYLGIEGFNIRNVDWYNTAKSVEDLRDEQIIEIIGVLKSKMSYTNFKTYINHYSITQLYDFYTSNNTYIEDMTLILQPELIEDEIEESNTLYTYEPKNLVEFKGVPIVDVIDTNDSIYICEEVVEPLRKLSEATQEINEKTFGNMIITQGYTSFKEQEKLYQDALLKHGIDDVLNYVSYPGQSIYQLGNVVKIVVAQVETENENQSLEISEQQKWLMEHALEYGFEFVNASEEPLSEFILQFVGIQGQTEIDEKGDDIE